MIVSETAGSVKRCRGLLRHESQHERAKRMNHTWLNMLFRGGVLMIPIAICSVVGLALILDRFVTYRKLRLEGFSLAGSVRHALARGDMAAAREHLEGDEDAGSRVLLAALARYHEGSGSIQNSFALVAVILVGFPLVMSVVGKLLRR